MAVYYVSNAGNNSNAGTSTSTSWKTISHVNSVTFNPGDTILFNGGQTFTGGPLDFISGGIAGNPIIVGSYGTGNATIQSSTTGIYIYDCAGFTIQNLNFTGTSAALTSGDAGISLYSDTSTMYTAGITINNCTISSWSQGISIGSSNSTSGFSNILIESCACYGNRDYGLVTYGPAFSSTSPYYAIVNLTITNCSTYSNLGNTSNTSSASGFGMSIGSVSNGLISYCEAYNNGIDNSCVSSGPVGLMIYASTGLTVQNCVTYNNQSGTVSDGDGFDFDDNTSNCSLEYCIAYNNYGAGILAYNASGNSHVNNVVRYNVSYGNCINPLLSGYYGDLTIYGTIGYLAAYNNSSVSDSSNGYSVPIWVSGTLNSVTVRNNIFYQTKTSGYCLYSNTAAYTTTQALIQGNDYYCASGFSIHWYSSTYASLSSWQTATSQEKIGATSTGSTSNPGLVSAVTAPSVTSPYNLTGANGLKLSSSSAIASAGLNLQSQFSVNRGMVDFWGTVLQSPFSIGATQPGIKGSFFPFLSGG
jgi:parallel beta-helix repeat protein